MVAGRVVAQHQAQQPHSCRGLVIKAYRLVYYSTLGLRVTKKRKEKIMKPWQTLTKLVERERVLC